MKLLVFLSVLFAPVSLIADYARYGGTHTVSATQGTMKVVHFHDWDSGKIVRLYGDVAHHEAFLGPQNDFSYIEVTDTAQQRHYRRPSSALSMVWISPDEKFIVGLSNIMLRNPYQIMVWRSDGRLLYQEHISPEVARLTEKEFESFSQSHPAVPAVFKGRIQRRDGAVYLDYEILNLGLLIGDDAWQFLFSHHVRNPYSEDFGSSITNYVYWFDAKDPNLAIKETDGMVDVSLSSPTGKTMHIGFPAK